MEVIENKHYMASRVFLPWTFIVSMERSRHKKLIFLAEKSVKGGGGHYPYSLGKFIFFVVK